MANGTVFYSGARGCGPGHTAIYTVSNGTWAAGPDFPGTYDAADSPGALETNGNVMVYVSPGIFNTGSVIYEWNGSSLNSLPAPPNAINDSSFQGHFLMLPTGQVLFTDYTNDVEIFTPTGSNYPGWQPSILQTAAVLSRGHTYRMFGFKFNGASQDSFYGDDLQNATNYPIFRFTNTGTGHVFYARTHGHNTMAVGYTGPSFTSVDLPANMETGAYNMQVVVNGIASQNYSVGIN